MKSIAPGSSVKTGTTLERGCMGYWIDPPERSAQPARSKLMCQYHGLQEPSAADRRHSYVRKNRKPWTSKMINLYTIVALRCLTPTGVRKSSQPGTSPSKPQLERGQACVLEATRGLASFEISPMRGPFWGWCYPAMPACSARSAPRLSSAAVAAAHPVSSGRMENHLAAVCLSDDSQYRA